MSEHRLRRGVNWKGVFTKKGCKTRTVCSRKWIIGGIILTKQKYCRKTCPRATLCTTNPTWTGLGLNSILHINRLLIKCLRFSSEEKRCAVWNMWNLMFSQWHAGMWRRLVWWRSAGQIQGPWHVIFVLAVTCGRCYKHRVTNWTCCRTVSGTKRWRRQLGASRRTPRHSQAYYTCWMLLLCMWALL